MSTERLNLKETLFLLHSDSIYWGMANYLTTYIQPSVERIDSANGSYYIVGSLLLLEYSVESGGSVLIPEVPRRVPFAFETGELYGLDYMGDGVWVNDEQRAKILTLTMESQPERSRKQWASEVVRDMIARLLLMMMTRYKGSIDQALGTFGQWLSNKSGFIEMPPPSNIEEITQL